MADTIYSKENLVVFANKVDYTSYFTPYHSNNVARLAHRVCKAMDIKGRKKKAIIIACLLHDVGKALIDSSILAKKGRLSKAEWFKVKIHPLISAKLAKEAGYNNTVVETLYYHHVWYNGRGYPRSNIRGRNLPLGSRILMVCDAYEAMTSKRSYRKKMTHLEAIEELKRYAILQFDPDIVEYFIRSLTEQ